MLAFRRVWEVLVGAWVCAWIVGGVLGGLLGYDGTWVGVAVIAAAALGRLLSIPAARKLEPMASSEKRDTVLGWMFIVGAAATMLCLTLPLPWSAIAAACTAALAAAVLRAYARVSRPAGSRGAPRPSGSTRR